MIRRILNVGKGNSELRSNVNRVILTVGNISFMHSLAKSLKFSAGKKTYPISPVIGLTLSAGEK